MTSMNITLPEPMRQYVDDQIATGSYGTASEYVRALIREDQKRNAQDRLETLLLEGLERGDAVEVSPQFWEDFRSRLDERRKKRDCGK